MPTTTTCFFRRETTDHGNREVAATFGGDGVPRWEPHLVGYRAKHDGYSLTVRPLAAGSIIQDGNQCGANVSARFGLIDGTQIQYGDSDGYWTPTPAPGVQATLRVNLPGPATALAGLQGSAYFNQALHPASGDITPPAPWTAPFYVRLMTSTTLLASVEPRWTVHGDRAIGTMGRVVTAAPFDGIELVGDLGCWVAYHHCSCELTGTWILANNRPADPWADGAPFPQNWREFYVRTDT